MRTILLAAVAATSLVGAPAISFAQQAGADSERAKIDAQLDDASKPKPARTTADAGALSPEPTKVAPKKIAPTPDELAEGQMDDGPAKSTEARSADAKRRDYGPPRTAKTDERPRDDARISASVDVKSRGTGSDRRPAATTTERVSSRTTVRSTNAVASRRSVTRERFASSDGQSRRVARSSLGGARLAAQAELPRSVPVRRMPPRVLRAAPEFQEFGYLETDDDHIVIVNPRSYRVVTVIEE